MDQFNLLDLDNDVLNIIGGYVKADNDERAFQEFMKKDMLQYVDLQMKIERIEARKGKYYISRSDTRTSIWIYFVKFCHNRFGTEYLSDIDKYVDVNKINNEYLTNKI